MYRLSPEPLAFQDKVREWQLLMQRVCLFYIWMCCQVASEMCAWALLQLCKECLLCPWTWAVLTLCPLPLPHQQQAGI